MEYMDLVAELKNRGFYLGGSRRMAEKYPEKIDMYIKPSTDWDFACEDALDKHQFLIEMGFELQDSCGSSNYWDDLLIDIYKHPFQPIDVLIRKEMDVYRSAFESLSAEVFIERLWKSSPLRHPNQPTQHFRRGVCDYFNGLFKLHGYNKYDCPF